MKVKLIVLFLLIVIVSQALFASYPKLPNGKDKFVAFNNAPATADTLCAEHIQMDLPADIDPALGCFIGVNFYNLARFAKNIRHTKKGVVSNAEALQPPANFSILTLAFKF